MRMPIVSAGESLEHRYLSLSLGGWENYSLQRSEDEGSETYSFAEDE